MRIGSSVSRATEAAVKGDYQVVKLESQIQDWKCCPTTDPKTKASKVTQLETQLEAVKSSIESREKSRSTLNILV